VSRWRQKVRDNTAEWLRAERDRRRLAFTTSQQQRQDGIARLARAGLHPVALPSLADALAEVIPPCM
jgi:hypothetical protein